MLFLSSARRLLSYGVVSDTTDNATDSTFPASIPKHYDVCETRTTRPDSQAKIMEETDPKQLAPVESTYSNNAPMIDNRLRRQSSLPEVNYTSLNHYSLESHMSSSPTQTTTSEKLPTPTKRLNIRRIMLIAICVIAITIALGVGLGIGLQKRANSTPVQSHGAINGSGVVAIDLDNTTKITAYTQRFDGAIVKSEYQNGVWSAGDDVGMIDTALGSFDGETLVARNGTPLMALSYENANELLWHVFYVTADDYLSDWINSNISQSWSQGTLRSSDFQVSNSSSVGLSACVNHAWYGAPHNISGLGIRLYYGSSDGIIQELGWNLGGQTTWFKSAGFPNSNGAGGVECTVRGASITYVWMENLQGELQQMWYDFNTSANTSSHPTETWVEGLTYKDIIHNSAISAINDFTANPPTKNVHFQAQNLSIVEIISNGTAENDTWERSFVVGTEVGKNGTRLGSVVLDTGLGGQEIHVLFQTNSTNMVDFVRGLTDRNWALLNVPVGM